MRFSALSLLTFLIACSNRQTIPAHTEVFRYSDEKSGETFNYYGFKDLDTAIHYAGREHKNVLLIFSGYASMAVGGQEWKTLSLFPDQNEIQEKFVIAWLPVDDKTIAADTGQVVYWYGKQRRLTTLGDKNKFLEESLYESSTQPLFCFMAVDKKPFGQKLGYTMQQSDVEAFMRSGLTK